MNGLFDREAEPELLVPFVSSCPQRKMQSIVSHITGICRRPRRRHRHLTGLQPAPTNVSSHSSIAYSQVSQPELLGIRNALIPVVDWNLSSMELLT